MPVETTGSTLVTDIGCLVGERNQSERCPRNAASCLRAQPTTFMEQPSNEPTGFANLQRRGCVHPRRLVSRSSLWSIVVCAVEREREREEKKKKKKNLARWQRRGSDAEGCLLRKKRKPRDRHRCRNATRSINNTLMEWPPSS